MARVYSSTLFATVINSTTEMGITVPEGYVWVIRDLRVWLSTPDYGMLCQLLADAITIGQWAIPAAGSRLFVEHGRIVAPGGVSLTTETFVPGGGIASIWASGYVLTLP